MHGSHGRDATRRPEIESGDPVWTDMGCRAAGSSVTHAARRRGQIIRSATDRPSREQTCEVPPIGSASSSGRYARS
jgi:hypothetical protein